MGGCTRGRFAWRLTSSPRALPQTGGSRRTFTWPGRAGPAQVPWLGPDMLNRLRQLRDAGVPGVVCVPVGFVSDHMEVVYDLDTEAAGVAADLGLPFARAGTPGTAPAFVSMVRDLLLEW